jgi:hypothetical protein
VAAALPVAQLETQIRTPHWSRFNIPWSAQTCNSVSDFSTTSSSSIRYVSGAMKTRSLSISRDPEFWFEPVADWRDFIASKCIHIFSSSHTSLTRSKMVLTRMVQNEHPERAPSCANLSQYLPLPPGDLASLRMSNLWHEKHKSIPGPLMRCTCGQWRRDAGGHSAIV